MKNIIIAAAIALTGTSVFAQPRACFQTEELVSAMRGEYKEQLRFAGHNPENKDVVVSVWVNNKTKTATIVKTSISQKVSCVVEVLEGAAMINAEV